MSAPFVCLVPEKARKRHETPWSWSYRWLQTATWVLASNLGSLQKQHERLPHGQISSTPEIFTFNKQAFALSILQSTQEIWLAHANTSRNYSAHERRQTQAVKITPTSSHLHGGNKKSLFILELIN